MLHYMVCMYVHTISICESKHPAPNSIGHSFSHFANGGVAAIIQPGVAIVWDPPLLAYRVAIAF